MELLDLPPFVYLLIALFAAIFFASALFHAAWGAIPFVVPAIFITIFFISLLFYRASSYKQAQEHEVAQIIKEGKPVVCGGVLIKNPQFKEIGDEVFVKLENGTLMSAYECRPLKERD